MQLLTSKKSLAVIILLSAVLASGCATTPMKPDYSAVPTQVACVYLQQPLSASGIYGLGSYTWITRLERGPYWSEREDENGTYYRAPPGGYSLKGPEGNAAPGFMATMDGGFYIPKNPTEPPILYRYFSTEAAPVLIPPEDADCSTVRFVKDPSTSKVSVWSLAAGGAIGGAAGGVVGRSMSPNSSIGYGQAAGIGAAGGLIAGVIIGAMINASVGKIGPGLEIKDGQFLKQLRKLETSKVPARELPLSAVGTGAKTTELNPVK